MKVILLERVERLGALGDVVTVKDGFARNFLLPNSKALRANSENLKVFEAQRAEIETRNAQSREASSKAGEKLDGRARWLRFAGAADAQGALRPERGRGLCVSGEDCRCRVGGWDCSYCVCEGNAGALDAERLRFAAIEHRAAN